MDKHDRPYNCLVKGCEKLQGFTYAGGLLRHEREVHKMHGGTGKSLYCPHTNCKRSTGSAFSRKENLAEHLRRVHSSTSTSPNVVKSAVSRSHKNHEKETPASIQEEDFALARSPNGELRVEVKRLRMLNEEQDQRLKQLEDAVRALQREAY
jgi:hypothetical protein